MLIAKANGLDDIFGQCCRERRFVQAQRRPGQMNSVSLQSEVYTQAMGPQVQVLQSGTFCVLLQTHLC